MSDDPSHRPSHDPSHWGVVRGRRAALASIANPAVARDFVVTLRARPNLMERPMALVLRYVPDRWILRAGALEGYLAELGQTRWPSPEAAAAAILDDIGDSLVPRWLWLSLIDGEASAARHAVDLEDRQPGWNNPGLLARLAPI